MIYPRIQTLVAGQSHHRFTGLATDNRGKDGAKINQVFELRMFMGDFLIFFVQTIRMCQSW